MKHTIALMLLLGVAGATQAQQWSGNNNTTDEISRTGNVKTTGMLFLDGANGSQIRLNSNGTYYGKIGNPWAQVWSLGWGPATSEINSVLTWTASGNVGIANSDPWERLHVNGTLGIGKFSSSPHAGLKIEYTDEASGSGTTVFKHQRWAGDFYFRRNGPDGERNQLHFGGVSNHYMDIYNGNNEVKVRLTTYGDSYFNGGNVGIGTSTPDARLTVDGNVKCEEVKVEIFHGTGPDYVFEDDYDLLTLSEVERYIKTNKHLPEVPSAATMEADGLNLKEMNLLLLKKVEELTLHIIRQEKRIEKLEAEKSKQK